MLKSKRSKACDILKRVKDIVWERDGHRCIFCGSPYAMPNAHFIPREKGGLGVEQNIVTLCQDCHFKYDQTTQRGLYEKYIGDYLKSIYSEWDKTKLYYKEKNSGNS